MKKLTLFLFLFLSVFQVFCQQTTCLNTPRGFSGDGNSGSYIWGVQDRVTGVFVNGQVATISGGVTQFGVAVDGASASNVSIRFNKAGLYRVRVVRFTNSWFGSTTRFRNDTEINVLGTTPTFAFAGSFGECGATFALNNTLEPGFALQWKREAPINSGIFVPIPGETGPVLNILQPFARLQLQATYPGCGAKSSNLDPPAGLGNLSLTSPDAFSPICANSNQEFTAQARFCDANAADAWTWFSNGTIQFTGPPINGNLTSSIKFIVVGEGFGSIVVQKGNTTSNPLSFDVLSFPNCEFLLRKPKESNDPLPTSLATNKDKSEGINITEDFNIEGVKSDVLKTNTGRTTSEKKLYPNPAKDFLTVEGISEVERIQIVDINGRVIRTIDIEKDEIGRTLNVSDLMNGIYILKKINRNGQLEAAKFQVIH